MEAVGDKLALIKQRLSEVAGADLSNIHQQLNLLYEQARSDDEKQAITAVWHEAQALQATTTNAIGMAADAMEIANAERHQRAELAEEYQLLENAVEGRDRDHDLVDDLIDDIQSETEEWLMENQLEESIRRMCSAISINPANITRAQLNAVQRFYYWMIEPDDADNELNAYQCQLLRDLIHSFIPDQELSDENN